MRDETLEPQDVAIAEFQQRPIKYGGGGGKFHHISKAHIC